MYTLSGMHILGHTWYGHQTLVAKWFFRHDCISIPIFYKKLWAIQKHCRSAVIHFSCNQNCHLWQFVPPQRNSFWCSTTSYLFWGCMLSHSQVIATTKSRLTPMSRTFDCHCTYRTLTRNLSETPRRNSQKKLPEETPKTLSTYSQHILNTLWIHYHHL